MLIVIINMFQISTVNLNDNPEKIIGLLPIIIIELIHTSIGSMVAEHIKLLTDKLKFAL